MYGTVADMQTCPAGDRHVFDRRMLARQVDHLHIRTALVVIEVSRCNWSSDVEVVALIVIIVISVSASLLANIESSSR